MALIFVQPPLAQQPASADSLSVSTLPVTTHCNDNDIVILSGSGIAPATANIAGGIVGIAQHDSNSNFGGATGQGAASLNTTIFPTQVGTGLFPSSPAGTLVVTLGPPVEVEISLTATTGWVTGGAQQANLGTAVGLAIDGTTGYFVADPTATNKVAVINSKPTGPLKGTNGDLGARVFIVFNTAALAIPQGH